MEVNDDVMQRLAFIRGLFSHATTQAQQPRPLAAIGLLQLHDAVELYLQLAAEHLQCTTRSKTEFMSYFDMIDLALAPNKLAYREGMRRLNQARVSLKHSGILPDFSHLQGFLTKVSAFLEENTPVIFGVELSSASLASLVWLGEAGQYLRRADKAIAENQRPQALKLVAIAFDMAVRDFNERLGLLLYYDRRAAPLNLSSRWDSSSEMQRLADFVRVVAENVQQLQRQAWATAIGADVVQLNRFLHMKPYVSLPLGRDRDPEVSMFGHHQEIAEDDLQFCYSFVIDTILGLQQKLTEAGMTKGPLAPVSGPELAGTRAIEAKKEGPP